MPSSFRTGECETNIEQEHSPLSRNCADKSFVFEGAVSCVFWRWPAGQLWILLGKGGVAAPFKKMSRSPLMGADGVVRSKEIVLKFGRTTPSAPFKGTGTFLDGASTPPLPRRGVCSAQAFSMIKCVYFTRLTPWATLFRLSAALIRYATLRNSDGSVPVFTGFLQEERHVPAAR